LVVRFYGEGSGEYVNRESEALLAAHLHAHSLAPRFYGRFHTRSPRPSPPTCCTTTATTVTAPMCGCVYGYVHGRVLTKAEVCHTPWYMSVAREFARWHNTTFSLPEGRFPRAGCVLDLAARWAGLVMAGEERIRGVDLAFLFVELCALVTRLRAKCTTERLVLCHNDLLPGNIVVVMGQEKSGSTHVSAAVVPEVRFIDFEYASYNAFEFDLANHFMGWACMYWTVCRRAR
jgi:Ser/Thr protein kinase RdoA (MazF antagonist)